MHIVWAGLILAGALQAGQVVERASSVERAVRFEYRAVNVSDRDEDVDFYLSLPRTNERQEVLFLRPEPGCPEVLTDGWGNPVAHWLEEGMRPGEVRTHGWIGAVRLHAAVWGPPADPVPALAKEDRALFTGDSRNYLIASPAVAAARDEAVKPGMGDREKALALFDWVIRHVTYFRDDRWDPAPEVIRNGKGSCSEFNYTLIALLRSCGIPCRYTGGFILLPENVTRYDPRVHEDAVFHRWTEIWLERQGWIPADASRASGALRRFDNPLNYWARLPAGSLQTFRGDGGGLLDWDYTSFARARGGGRVRDVPVCFWIDAPVDRVEAALADAESAVAGGLRPEALGPILADPLRREALFLLAGKVPAASYPALAEGLLRARHPSAVYCSVLAARKGIEVPASVRPEAMAGEHLLKEVRRRAGESPKAWGEFEHWWRKARPLVSFDPARNVFILPEGRIDLD